MSNGISSNQQSYAGPTFIKKTDGYLYAAGYNLYGQSGDGTTTDNTTFGKVLLPAGVSISLLGWFATSYPTNCMVALLSDGRLFGWGYNAQNGVIDSTTNNVLAPIQFALSGN